MLCSFKLIYLILVINFTSPLMAIQLDGTPYWASSLGLPSWKPAGWNGDLPKEGMFGDGGIGAIRISV